MNSGQDPLGTRVWQRDGNALSKGRDLNGVGVDSFLPGVAGWEPTAGWERRERGGTVAQQSEIGIQDQRDQSQMTATGSRKRTDDM